MKMTAFTIGALVLAALSSGTLHAEPGASLYIGPFLSRTVGDDRDAVHVTCRINLQTVDTDYFVGKENNKPALTESVKIDLYKDYPKLWDLLAAAKKAPINSAKYIQENRPNFKIEAVQNAKDTKPFILIDDSGSRDVRAGKAAKELRTITNKLCGSLTWEPGDAQIKLPKPEMGAE